MVFPPFPPFSQMDWVSTLKWFPPFSPWGWGELRSKFYHSHHFHKRVGDNLSSHFHHIHDSVGGQRRSKLHHFDHFHRGVVCPNAEVISTISSIVLGTNPEVITTISTMGLGGRLSSGFHHFHLDGWGPVEMVEMCTLLPCLPFVKCLVCIAPYCFHYRGVGREHSSSIVEIGRK